jgi:hypothetical protein
MSATKTLVFRNVAISNFTGANTNYYSLHDTESAEVTVEKVNDTIDNNQMLASAYDVSFTVKAYESNVTTDPFVYKDTSATPTLARMSFIADTGGQTLNVENVIVNLSPDFSGTRLGWVLEGSKRVTNAILAVNLP